MIFIPAFSHATSVASYTPRNSSDYGTLMCIGTNSVGTQYVPCVFHIVPAGKYYKKISILLMIEKK